MLSGSVKTFNRSDRSANPFEKAINRSAETINNSEQTINRYEEIINQSEETINQLEEPINQLEEAIKYNLLHFSTLFTALKKLSVNLLTFFNTKKFPLHRMILRKKKRP